MVDKKSGKVYYYNKVTRLARPPLPAQCSPAPAPRAASLRLDPRPRADPPLMSLEPRCPPLLLLERTQVTRQTTWSKPDAAGAPPGEPPTSPPPAKPPALAQFQAAALTVAAVQHPHQRGSVAVGGGARPAQPSFSFSAGPALPLPGFGGAPPGGASPVLGAPTGAGVGGGWQSNPLNANASGRYSSAIRGAAGGAAAAQHARDLELGPMPRGSSAGASPTAPAAEAKPKKSRSTERPPSSFA